MWRSKKRLLLLASGLALVGAVAAGGIAVAGGWLEINRGATAAVTPPAKGKGAKPQAAPSTPPQHTPPSAPPSYTPPQSQYSSPSQPYQVRANDGGSYSGPSSPPPRFSLGDQPTPASQEISPANSGGGFPSDINSPLPNGGSPRGPEFAPAPPVGLAPATGNEQLQPPPAGPGEFSPPPSASMRRSLDDRSVLRTPETPTATNGRPSNELRVYDDSAASPPVASGIGAGGYSRPTNYGGDSLGNNARQDALGGIGGNPLPPSGLVANGAGEPGPKQLEGLRSPSLTIEKVVPAEVQVGKQATFEIKVRNVGPADAEQVVVFDQTPKGTRYVSSSPEAARAPDGSLMWQLGTLKSGEEAVVAMQLMPVEEGKIGSVARVAFQAQASASTICTKPLLTVEHTGPSSVLIGETVNLQILISNPGTGVASGVILEEDVPDGLSHERGKELEYEVGELRPGESKKLTLQLTAEKPGLISNLLLVRGEGNLIAEDRLELEVVAPRLDVALTGPSKRYLERQATYSVAVQNPGTAPAENIELVAYLPKGLKFISTNNQGQYDAQNHAVYWSLEELPPRMSGEVQLTALPIETGQQKVRVEGRGDLGLSATFEQDVVVEGLAELFFQVADQADPIEVGSQTVYEVQIVNQGSKTDTNVRIEVQFPTGLKPLGGDGPTRTRVVGQSVVCEPLARLAPKESVVYKFSAIGQQAGDQRIRVNIVSDEVRTPIAKEESTRVYTDQ